MDNQTMNQNTNLEIATLGGGCFWCVEAIFQRVKGVEKVVSGYSGGQTQKPSYKAVCSGTTGHAEVIQVHFDPKIISYKEVLEIFFHTHDPTTLNRQGNDRGTQYRSAIFYHSDTQKQQAEEAKKTIDNSGYWGKNAVTEITKFETFYPAEDYHQDYYALNSNQGYCRVVIEPKIKKFMKNYGDKLKD